MNIPKLTINRFKKNALTPGVFEELMKLLGCEGKQCILCTPKWKKRIIKNRSVFECMAKVVLAAVIYSVFGE